jgi:DNA recombination protein RmuC
MTTALVLLLVLAVGVLGAVVGWLASRRAPGTIALPPPGPPPIDPTLAMQQALSIAVAELRQHAAGEREAAIRAAVEQATVLNREVIGRQVAVGQQELLDKKEQLDTRLNQVQGEVRDELARVSEMVRQLGTSSQRSFGEVSAALNVHAEMTASLSSTTQGLREALASTKARGQWGERMAEDVLRLAGFVENVNYRKQVAIEGGRGMPDFTFDLPKGHCLYMDVKFPVTSYLRTLDARTDVERRQHRDTFLRDVRVRVKELSQREYAQAGTASTVDYVLMFLPNESISGFIFEADPTLMDDAMRQKVVLCSPLTLFAMLGVIRQAFDNFMIERTSDEILKVLGTFEQQWQKFADGLETMGKRIESTQKAFEELNGPRRRMLERPLSRLDAIRRERGLPDEGTLAFGEVHDLGDRRSLGA